MFTATDEKGVPFKSLLLEAQIEASLDGILVVSPDGKILSFNRRFAELWRIPPDVLARGSDDAAIDHVLNQLVDADAFVSRIRYLYSHPEETSFDVLHLKDGRVFERHSTAIRGEGVHYGRIWFFHDVTAQKQVEADLRQAQETYRNLVDSVDGIVWEVEAETFRFTFVSQQAERLLGYPVQDWLEGPTFWADHIHPDDRSWAVQFCIKATQEKRNHEFEYRMVASDGRIVWLRDLVTVIVEEDKTVTLRGIMVDITRQKVAEEQVKELNGRLSERLSELEQFEDAVIGRELKMIELEKEVRQLRSELERERAIRPTSGNLDKH